MGTKVTHKTPLNFIPEALLFDIFGTVFDWRSTVVTHLERVISSKLAFAHANIDATIKSNLATPEAIKHFCSTFAVEWEDYYIDYLFTKDGKPKFADPASANEQRVDQLTDTATTPQSSGAYTTLDTIYSCGLATILSRHGLSQLFTTSEVLSISRIWHNLQPWPDSKAGIEALRELSIVCPLSNGNVRLLVDLQKNSGVAFDMLLSAQLWNGYKPEKRIYVGACEILGIGGKQQWDEYVEECRGKGEEVVEEKQWRKQERGKVAMVASHLFDLRAAKSFGMTTIFIHRPEEIETDIDEYIMNGEDWVDMWVTTDEGGILEVARRLRALKAL
ncbi:hypothetical protein TWF506_008937 [Arthrobotrys conoides]|uniref:Haloacid dehalogenase n=1 Tax=Arthrobotrys conoides TaxID=74498 RepID=A0AAN8NCZ0_9PEZI